MDRYFLYLCFFAVAMVGLGYFFIQADAGREMSIPPTNAVTLNPNDYLELYVGNLNDDDDAIVKTVNIFALGM